MSFFGNNSSLTGVIAALNAVSERQKVSSANLANAQTPGYTAKHVSFADLLRTDNPFETQLSQEMGSQAMVSEADSGQPVDIQRELIEMQKNTLFYSMVTRRASSIFNALRTAGQVGR